MRNHLSALTLLLSGLFLSACATQTPVSAPPRIEAVYPALPETSCTDQPDIPAGAVTDAASFRDWLSSDAGRRWLVAGRAAGHDCYIKLRAVHDAALKWR